MTLGTLLPFLVLIVAFYFLILRPARTRQAAQAAVRSKLEPGVEAMTTSGLFGTVTAVDGDKVSPRDRPRRRGPVRGRGDRLGRRGARRGGNDGADPGVDHRGRHA